MKQLIDFKTISVESLGACMSLLKFVPAKDEIAMPEIAPGQFVEVKIPNGAAFLRRPISVNFVDSRKNELWLLVRDAGKGTHELCNLNVGDIVNILLPLGRGFSMPEEGVIPVLVGGGVGIAPLLHFGCTLHEKGIDPIFVLGARSQADLAMAEYFNRYGHLCISTEDGSAGTAGLVTENPVFSQLPEKAAIYCCGPLPMMKAVARMADSLGLECEVSLENKMACGLGACLCCVEETTTGNRCVCTDGPVFNSKELKW